LQCEIALATIALFLDVALVALGCGGGREMDADEIGLIVLLAALMILFAVAVRQRGYQMIVLRWMFLIFLAFPIIGLVFGMIRLWELLTGERVDFDGPKRLRVTIRSRIGMVFWLSLHRLASGLTFLARAMATRFTVIADWSLRLVDYADAAVSKRRG
jgi:hypothetical protein